MTEEELRRFLVAESSSVDWKAGGDPEKIVKTLAAYANDFEDTGSGFVICGVQEVQEVSGRTAAEVVGISPGDSRRLRDRIFQLSRSIVSPPLEPQFETVPLGNERAVLVIWIAASGEVHLFRDAVVVRLGDKVTNASVTQIAELAQKKAHLDWLAQSCPGAALDDIDLFALQDLTRRFRLTGETSTFLQPEFRMFGSALPLTGRVEGPSGVTIAPRRFALLLIGKEPQRFLPGAFVALTRFPGVTRSDAVFSSAELFGPIPLLVEKVMGALDWETGMITDKTQDFRSGAQNQRRYSLQALREILVNALAHRDYRSSLSTKIFVFQDRIEFENPGGLEKGMSVESLKRGRTNWRNPALARYLSELGLAQERGTGIPKAIEETLSVAGVEPTFDVDTQFRVTVPAYRPSIAQEAAEQAVHPEAGILLISIGHGTIDIALVRRSVEAFREVASDVIRAYHYPGLVEPRQWPIMIREFRDWMRSCLEETRFQELHLFYRGPVAAGPLMGAMAAGRKPMAVYYYDEDSGIYRFAYRLDRRLLQSS